MKTKFPPLKTWKAGHADEIWKLMICARDYQYVEETFNSLVYILLNAEHHPGNCEHNLNMLRAMSGNDIVEGLLAYGETCYQSVKNGYPNDKEPKKRSYIEAHMKRKEEK